jgi:uncharacterized protein YfcZ (UPF0381/DUF406 family)
MSDDTNSQNGAGEVCEACGCSAEVGFMIKEGDEVADVSLFGESKQLLEQELAKYIALAQQINANVVHEVATMADDAKELHAKFKFEVSAEKLIFELKSRSI